MIEESYTAAQSSRVDAANDLNPFSWEYREIVDVELVKFENDNGTVDKKVVVHIDPAIGEGGTTFSCNRTREKALVAALGSKNPNDWVGQSIAIRQGKTSYMGKDYKVVEIADQSPEAVKADPKNLDDIPY